MKRRYVEDPIHAGIVAYLRTVLPECIVFHPPNGAHMAARQWSKMKWLGALPGIPDIIILRPKGQFAAMEVKAPRGVLSEDQQAVRYHCVRYAMPYAVVHSIDEARAALAQWGVETREAAA